LNHSYADRLKDIEPFRVMEILAKAKALEAAGRDIIHLEVGEPDFSTIDAVVAAGQQSLARGDTHYCPAAGLPALRQAIAGFYQQRYGVSVDPGRIMVTPGASGALLLIAALLVNPGEGLLMTDPGYPCNRHFLRLVEGRGHLVPVGSEDCYQLSAEKAAQHWQDNTRGVMVASPANPSGEMLSKQALLNLNQLCQQKNGYLVVDEIYHGLTYGEKATSVLELTDQAFVINSFSKYFGMTGWRVGWLVAPENAIPDLEKLAQNLFISVSTMAQHAALAAFESASLALFDQRRDEFAERRDYLLPQLRRLGFEIPHTPAGAFYLYAGISKFSNDGQQFCLDLLEQQGVAITPGVDFGSYRANEHVRFAYTASLERLTEAVARLEVFLSA
jgi:aspartate/methionine/tyrosine aminotransferase